MALALALLLAGELEAKTIRGMAIKGSAVKQGVRKASGARISSEVKAKLSLSANKLNSIEKILAQIENKKLITEEKFRTLSEGLLSYAKATKEALELTVKNARRAPRSLNSVETAAKAHTQRVKEILSNAKGIEA